MPAVAAQQCEVSVVCSETTPNHRALSEVDRNFTLFGIASDFR